MVSHGRSLEQQFFRSIPACPSARNFSRANGERKLSTKNSHVWMRSRKESSCFEVALDEGFARRGDFSIPPGRETKTDSTEGQQIMLQQQMLMRRREEVWAVNLLYAVPFLFHPLPLSINTPRWDRYESSVTSARSWIRPNSTCPTRTSMGKSRGNSRTR